MNATVFTLKRYFIQISPKIHQFLGFLSEYLLPRARQIWLHCSTYSLQTQFSLATQPSKNVFHCKELIIYLHSLFVIRYLTMKSDPVMAIIKTKLSLGFCHTRREYNIKNCKHQGCAIAQWIRLRLPFCCPGFESHPPSTLFSI